MFKTARFRRAALAGCLALCVGQAHAGLIVVSGDENITDALTGNGTAVNVGDQRFFANLLGTGTHVLVQGTDLSGIDTPVANTNTFFNTLAGVSSTIQSGPLTSASFSGINLFVSAIPSTAFTSAEITAIGNFSAAGGSLFLMGDALGFSATQDANLNALLIGIGSSLRIVPANLDGGFQTASGSHIATNPLTAGISSFTYAFVSQVSGGTSLFTTSGGQTFIAETNTSVVAAVPEPASISLLGLGLIAAAALRRKAKR